MQVLQGCGWLARLTRQPAHERPHGRYTVINLAWERPGATERTRGGRKAAVTAPAPAPTPCQNLSPLQGLACAHLSPMAAQESSIIPENTDGCADAIVALFQPFQEEGHDPEPTKRGPTGAPTCEGQENGDPLAAPSPLPQGEPVSEDEYAAATARLVAQGTDPAFLIRPVLLAEVQRVRDEVTRGPAVAPGQATAVTVTDRPTSDAALLPPAPAVCPPTLRVPQAPATPACARPPTRTPPPTLREVTLADLAQTQQVCYQGQ